MARRTKDAPGRVTPKGGGRQVTHSGRTTQSTAQTSSTTTSGRYTAPIPSNYETSPWWVLPLLLAFLGAGALVIILNYLTVLPHSASNIYLLVGLVLITFGFITATRLK